MKKRNFRAAIAALVLGLGVTTLTGCGTNLEYVAVEDYIDGYYVMQAEDTNIEDLSGVAFSGNYPGYDMIRGDNSPSIPSNVKNSISGRYFVSYLNANDLELVFEFESDKASTGHDLVLRMGSEFGMLLISPESLQVIVNDEEITYDDYDVKGKMGKYEITFADETLSTKIDIVEGSNSIVIVIKDTLAFGVDGEGSAFGPGIDCIKIKASEDLNLTWKKLFEKNFHRIKENN